MKSTNARESVSKGANWQNIHQLETPKGKEEKQKKVRIGMMQDLLYIKE